MSSSWYEIEVAGDAAAWERLLAEQETACGLHAVREREATAWLKTPQAPPAGRSLAFAPGELARRLLTALAPVGLLTAPGPRLAEVREVRGGRFRFTVEAFAAPAAAEIRAVLAAPPPGVEVRITRDEEERDRAAHTVDGAEAAAGAAPAEPFRPLHCPAFRAWGTVAGPLPGLVEMHRRLHPLPFVYEERIELAAQRIEPAAVAAEAAGAADPAAAATRDAPDPGSAPA